MYVYSGKIDFERAVNESITFVFPIDLALQDTVCVYWQWSDRSKENNTQASLYGTIHEIMKTDTRYSVCFMCSSFQFEADFTPDLESMTVKMYTNPLTPSVTTISRSLSTPSLVPTTKVYTGKFSWPEEATNEMMTLDAPRTRYSLSSTFHTVEKFTAQIKASFDTFDVVINYLAAKSAKVTRRGATASQAVDLQQTDWRQARKKRALIMRADTGGDNGIFLLRDMLTRDLDLSPEDIEVYYYDSQRAPTGNRLTSTLYTLLSSAQPGDVRFLYLDVQDGGRGITMAKTDYGGRNIYSYGTVVDTVRQYLKPGVNFTLISTSPMGGSIGGGFMVSAVTETQDAMKHMQVGWYRYDPWLYAIMAVIKKQVKDHGSIPTYTALFNGAKKFLKTPYARSLIMGDNYKGASEDELKPTGTRVTSVYMSNQDPQLMCFGQSNPDEERFLCPLVSSGRVGQTGSDSVTRFPRDEYPTDCAPLEVGFV
ncbi:hypothetical protein K523DRAFT_365892 [Schizophyllum commune Tattone D]|nr:hypothetical protein K523DRAFT_365892 [Schizophyllum commune Tattone D]